MNPASIKLLRTIRFDDSDKAVYARAADAGEWAVSGAFEFADRDAGSFAGKLRQAFANGFLGVTSFGRSTFVVVGEAQAADRDEIVFRLARHFVERYGAPDLAAAVPAAEEEIAFAASLAAEQPLNTVLTVRRTTAGDGNIKEEFRTIRPPAGEPLHARIWTLDTDEA